MRAGRKPLEATTPTRPASRLALSRLVVPAGEAKQAEVLGHGPDARRGGRRPARADRGGVVNLVLVEHADGVATEVSLQALALAADARWRDARAADRAGWCRSGCRACRWPSAHVAEHAGARRVRARRLGGDHLRASPSGSARRRSSRRAPGRRPTRWPARPFASASRSPPTSPPSRAGTPLSLTRLRWGGSLLEEAAAARRARAADRRAAHGRRGRGRRARLGGDVHAGAGRGRPRRARARPRRAAGGRRLARRREGRRHRRPRRRLGGGLRRDRGARRRCSAAPSAARAR